MESSWILDVRRPEFHLGFDLLLILTQNSRALCADRASGLETWSILKVEQQGLYLAWTQLSVQ
jgi:hypothetical protein